MSDQHIVVFIAADPHQAHLLRNQLDEAGIDAYVTNDTLNGVHFAAGDWMVRAAGGPGFMPNTPRVVVQEKDAEEARRIVVEAERVLLGGQAAPELVELVEQNDSDHGWPMCPSCARLRLATCPVCETSGTDFEFAFLPEGAETEARPVLCPTCDEAFLPKHPNRCEWCGYRFTAETEPRPEPVAEPPGDSPADYQFNARAGILLAGMALAALAMVGWFYYVLH